jgi:RNA polymerase sigma-70 factor (ECF subfamily)
LEQELNTPPDAEEQRTACACVESIIPTLKPDYAELIRRLDLDQQAMKRSALNWA